MRSTVFAVNNNTPSITAVDNRDLTVRNIAYARHPDAPDLTDKRITRHKYDARGFLTRSTDHRLHGTCLANFTYLTDLAGNALRAKSVDLGTSVTLNDAAGRPIIAISNLCSADDGTEDKGQAVTRTWQYEEASLRERPLEVRQQVNGGAACIAERFIYAGSTLAEKARNLSGQCVSHYDTAGLVQTDSFGLTSVPLSVARHLLKNADNADTVVDWQGEDESAWNDLLDDAYITLTMADATGAVLSTTDAKDNVQRVAYDVAGRLSGSWLTVNEGAEQVIVKSLTHSAAGQKLREEHGNGVVTVYTYEPQTHRLVQIKTQRPCGHIAGTKVLQDLRYEYDPVGNVLSVRNNAEETRYGRNQKVVPENAYVYDSLYQLICATGREMVTAGQQSSNLPPAAIPFSTDSSAYTNYTRTYTYDTAGNLTQIRHSSPATNNNYTTAITISDCSNRGILSAFTTTPSEVDALFTAGGQQKQLLPGQQLSWTPRNELLKVNPVVRDGAADDGESYRYDAGSQRVLKVSMQKIYESIQTQRVVYLAGLELRTTKSGETEKEVLQVITARENSHAQIRILHWTAGKPADISNNQVRYNYNNLIGSSMLELDGDGNIISAEEYYPYGGTAIWTARCQVEANYKVIRYSGKERDAAGLYYYRYRYYQPWAGRWLSADPAGTVDGLNLFRMARNNPIKYKDENGLMPNDASAGRSLSTSRKHNDGDLISEIRAIFTPLLIEIKITDTPYLNSNGITQYRHDENHQMVRSRRLEIAKKFNLPISDAVNDREYQLSLANKVANQRDANGKIFGQCAEMAYLSASKLENLARSKSYNVFTFQQPDANHTITLLSKNNYKPGEQIRWGNEQKNSFVVDLWQGTISPDHPFALVSHAHEHIYTRHSQRSFIQAKAWSFSIADTSKKTGTGNISRGFRNFFK